ncbi:MAG: hypothetical protein EA364_15480 [Balneolaceae bacterium]|nr:MAG: hypothetical protein EA364_15480 [Balneolaceae bacterium]
MVKTILEIDYGSAQPATVTSSVFRTAAEFELDGELYSMESTSLLKGHYVLRNGTDIIAEATKPSVWSGKYTITYGNVRFELKPESFFRSGYKIIFRDIEIGSVKKKSVWNYSATMQIPASTDTVFGIFLYWIIFVTWKQNNAAAAAGG